MQADVGLADSSLVSQEFDIEDDPTMTKKQRIEHMTQQLKKKLGGCHAGARQHGGRAWAPNCCGLRARLSRSVTNLQGWTTGRVGLS